MLPNFVPGLCGCQNAAFTACALVLAVLHRRPLVACAFVPAALQECPLVACPEKTRIISETVS